MCIVRSRTLAAAASVLLFATMAWAGSSNPQNNSMAKPTAMDRSFMDKAAQGGMAEVQLGQLAEKNGQSQEVKDFGKRMVTDHSKANDELKQVAGKQDVTLPSKMDATDQATYDRLEKLHGAEFDQAYMHDMVRDHEKDVADFRSHEKTIKDTDLKDWISTTLPTLESHLSEARKVATTVGVKAGPSSARMSPGPSSSSAK